MKGSRVQSIIKELRGEKIDIIEWSDEPSVFAANALSPAKVSQARITDIEKRKMHVIVGEDQLSLAIGKKGQNVRLATRLVGWDIDIVSEEVLKKEIAQQMGRMMASGEAVPITALEGVNANQAEILAEKGVDDVEKLAAMSIDDLVDALDLTFDDAERIIAAAREVVAAKEGDNDADGEESAVGEETAEVETGDVDVAIDQDEPVEGASAATESAEETAAGEPGEVVADSAADLAEKTSDEETAESSDGETEEIASEDAETVESSDTEAEAEKHEEAQS
jgi:N utilization substance protein A